MGRAIEIIDPEGRARYVRRRRFLVVAVLIHLGILSIPEIHSYQMKWRTLTAAKKLALFLSSVKTRAIFENKPLEVRFIQPDKLEVYSVTDCVGSQSAAKQSEANLGEFAQGVRLVDPAWIASHPDLRPADNAKVLQSFCFDPLKGALVFQEGVTHGEIPLSFGDISKENSSDTPLDISWVKVEGINADFSLE